MTGAGPHKPGSLPARTVANRTAREEEDERQLKAARDSFPGWEIREVFDGFLAVPAGTVVIHSTDLDSIVRKLREQG